MQKKIMLLFIVPSTLFGMGFSDLLDEGYRTEYRIREERKESAKKEYDRTHNKLEKLEQETNTKKAALSSLKAYLSQEEQSYAEQCKQLSTKIAENNPALAATRLAEIFQKRKTVCEKELEKINQEQLKKKTLFEKKIERHTQKIETLQTAITELKLAIKKSPRQSIQLRNCIALFNNEESIFPLYQTEPPSYEDCEKNQEESCTTGPSAPEEISPYEKK